jgi:serine/threonine protein kinase
LQANAPFAYSPLAPPQSNARHSKNHLALGLGLGCTLGVLLVALLSALFFYHRLKTRRTSPYDLSTSKSLQRFSYQQLKKATGGFAEARKLGQGGFGAVFKGELRYGDEVAVKSVDVSTVQGEVAFQNEVSIIGRITSPRIVRLLGFCAHGPRRLLVYEFMANRNLQEALFDEVYAVPLDWAMRFRIIHNVAEGLAYLHFKCDPPIIHGDVKPSNVLLDANFHAKLADFGLARVKTAESILEVQTLEAQREAIEKERARYERIVRDRARQQKRREEAERKKKDEASRANSVKGESMESFAFDPNPEGDRKSSASLFDGLSTEEETSGFTLESPCSKAGNNTPTSVAGNTPLADASESPALTDEKARRSGNDVTDTEETSWQDCDESRSYPPSPMSVSKEIRADADGENFLSAEEGETDVDKSVISMSIDGTGEEGWSTVSPSQPDLEFNFEISEFQKKRSAKGNGSLRSWSRDWWRKQEKDDGNRSQHVQDSDTKSIRSILELERSEELATEGDTRRPKNRSDLRRQRSKSSGWIGAIVGDLSKEMKKKTPASKQDKLKGREWWREEYCEELSNKSREFKKGSSMRLDRSRRHKKDDYTKWIRDFSQEFSAELGHSKNLDSRRESRRSRSRREEFWSGDSAYRGISSTPSMRGTICYVAPESGGAGATSERSDVYSFGVLLLVLISGRRPLQVNASPMTDFERANLISWARLLAQSGNVLELVDSNLHSAYSEDQAVLCITVALLCLQRFPAARPSMSDIVKILNGERALPDLPFEFSPSPPGFRSRRKPSADEISLDRAPVTF